MEEKRDCSNCGRTACSHSIVAYLWDYCVEDNFTKYWMPKSELPKSEPPKEDDV